jgi:prolycopene isomerase
MPEKYDCIVVGAGIGGLTCASLLAKNGLKTVVFEQHFKPGGYVTSYELKGFTFDIPDVIGACRPSKNIGRLFSYMGLDKEIKLIEFDPYLKFIYPDHSIKVWTNVDKYEEELSKKFPHESRSIHRYFETMKKMWHEICMMPIFPKPLQMPSFPIKYPGVLKYLNKTFQNLLDEHFEDSKLKTIISTPWPYIGVHPSQLSAITMVGMLMSYHDGAFRPVGPFQDIPDALAKKLQEFGGEICLKTRVRKILIERGKATGVELEEGEIVDAEYVISNADTKRTFLELVGREHLKSKFVQELEGKEVSLSGFVVHLGVDMDLEKYDLNYATVFYFPSYNTLDDAYKLAKEGKIITGAPSMGVGISVPTLASGISELAPEGKHCIALMVYPVPYNFENYWRSGEARRHTTEYRKLKDELAAKLIKVAENIIPELSRRIEVTDIATPLTFERFTLSSNGAWYDLAVTPGQTNLHRPHRTPILNLYLTGAKSSPGVGMFGAMSSGLLTADTILKGKLTGGGLTLKGGKAAG